MLLLDKREKKPSVVIHLCCCVYLYYSTTTAAAATSTFIYLCPVLLLLFLINFQISKQLYIICVVLSFPTHHSFFSLFAFLCVMLLHSIKLIINRGISISFMRLEKLVFICFGQGMSQQCYYGNVECTLLIKPKMLLGASLGFYLQRVSSFGGAKELGITGIRR